MSIFLDKFSRIAQILNVMKICHSMRKNRRTEKHDKLAVTFLNFVRAPNKTCEDTTVYRQTDRHVQTDIM
jgi:hypothetical protein